MKDIYKEIYTFSNLYRAYRQAAKCKRKKREVVEFELNLADNLWSLHYELKEKIYTPREYHVFKIHDPKEREIQALTFRDRVVQACLCENALREYFDNRLVYDCAACRKGKGTHFAMRRLSMFMSKFYKEHGTKGYILKADIRKYIDSINHEVLKKILSSYPDKNVLEFLYRIIDNYEHTPGKGLPMGNQSSQWFALYYLDKVDRIIKEKYRIKYYSRYMDDFILIHESKEYLRECLNEIKIYIYNELKLELNEKTQIFPISHGVDYVGFRFYLTESGKVIRRLRTSNKKRFKRRMKAFAYKYSIGMKTLDEINQSIASYNGQLKHGHTYKLKEKIYGKIIFVKNNSKEY